MKSSAVFFTITILFLFMIGIVNAEETFEETNGTALNNTLIEKGNFTRYRLSGLSLAQNKEHDVTRLLTPIYIPKNINKAYFNFSLYKASSIIINNGNDGYTINMSDNTIRLNDISKKIKRIVITEGTRTYISERGAYK